MNVPMPNQNVRIAVGSGAGLEAVHSILAGTALLHQTCDSLEALVDFEPSVIVADAPMLSDIGLKAIREALPHCPIMATTAVSMEVEFPIPDPVSADNLFSLLRTACELRASRIYAEQAQKTAAAAESDLTKLADVSVALSAERDLSLLLKKILESAQDISFCDAASLYLLDDKVDPNELIFKLTLNDSLDNPFREQRFAVSRQSISGYVAMTAESVDCEDVYMMGPEQPFRFNRDFDAKVGYRTKSLFCVPMVDYRNKVVGVLQFINRKHRREDVVTIDNVDQTVTDFDEQVRKSLSALASLSAVAIQTRMLVDDINNLFENFVHAAVRAIEQRDPTTSGHSFRVADLSVALAQRLPDAKRSDLIRFQPTSARLRELRYAALLHDFGKVGVSEHVLVKAKKLYDWELQELNYRIQLTRQRLRADTAEQIIALMERGRGDSDHVLKLQHQFREESQRLDHFLETIIAANEPSVLAAERKESLDHLGTYHCDDHTGDIGPLLSPRHMEALSMPRGSLTLDERKEIESHVVHTYNFLNMIPWTDELSGIPDIAGRHHEKLNGGGYPTGLEACDIPLQSRVMTICDIYDALTASDRPYKAAIPDEIAYRILREDADRGMLDRDIVELFIGAGVSEVTRGKEYPATAVTSGGDFHHSVCDPDTHEH